MRMLSFASLQGNTLTTHYFNCTLSGTFELTRGIVDRAVSFGGSGSYATIIPASGSGLLNLTGIVDSGITIRIRIKFTQFIENDCYMTTGADEATGQGIALFYRFGRMFAIFATETEMWTVSFSANDMLSFKTWYKFELSWSAATGLSVYINDGFVVKTTVTMTRTFVATRSVVSVYLATCSETSINTAVIEVEEFATFTSTRTFLVEMGGWLLGECCVLNKLHISGGSCMICIFQLSFCI